MQYGKRLAFPYIKDNTSFVNLEMRSPWVEEGGLTYKTFTIQLSLNVSNLNE